MSEVSDILALNQKLLDCIDRRDWSTYEELCDPSLTAFEPEALGHRVEGLPFHQFYFQPVEAGKRIQTTMSAPHVRLLGDTAIVCYVRLSQRSTGGSPPTTVGFSETRVWHRQNGQWRHVHFHRSPVS